MLKIILNGSKVIEINATMDTRIGQEIEILGVKAYIEHVVTTDKYIEVNCVDRYGWENKSKSIFNKRPRHPHTENIYRPNPFNR